MLSDQETARYLQFLQTIPPPTDLDRPAEDEAIEAAWRDGWYSGFRNGLIYERYLKQEASL